MEETAAPAPAPEARTTGPTPPVRSIGQRLRAGRERSGLSVAATAEKLHLDPKVIDALESDRFTELGASVYVRGHLRRYADFVGEPGVELVATYTAQRESRPPPPDLTQVPHAERRSDPRRLVTPLAGLACAAVLALAIWWVLSGSKPGAVHGDVQPTLNAEQVAAAQTPTGVANSPAVTAVPASMATAPVAAAAAPATDPAAPARKEEAAPAHPTRLKLELANDSWVEVYDSRGERLFYDVATAGSVQSVEGRPPLRVVLGNSVGVAVEVDGQRREIPSNATDGEGARFVVNRSGSLSRAR
jgi:cytoskeleton protein RodZ